MGVGRLSLRHLERSNAGAPHIDGHAVAVSLNELRRHPEGRADDGAALLVLGGSEGAREHVLEEVDGEAEVGEFDVSLRVHQNVIAFDVCVEGEGESDRDGFGSWSGARRGRGAGSGRRTR